jgi:hypothetical protein
VPVPIRRSTLATEVLDAPAAVQDTIRRDAEDITTDGNSLRRRVEDAVYEATVLFELQVFPLFRDSIQRMLDPLVAPRLHDIVVHAEYATPITDVPASAIAGA